MNHKYLNKKNNDKIIIFFNGWGMDENVVEHLEVSDFDVVMFYDYCNLDIQNNIFEEINDYNEKYLIAWSMGVGVSSIFCDNIENITRKIAINGTLKPIDNDFGIPEKIYDMTANNFNEVTLKKFVQKMFINGNVPKALAFQCDVAQKKDELVALKNYKTNINCHFDKAIISANDRIFSPKNQLNFWESQIGVDLCKIETGHCPFFEYTSWKELL